MNIIILGLHILSLGVFYTPSYESLMKCETSTQLEDKIWWYETKADKRIEDEWQTPKRTVQKGGGEAAGDFADSGDKDCESGGGERGVARGGHHARFGGEAVWE